MSAALDSRVGLLFRLIFASLFSGGDSFLFSPVKKEMNMIE